MKNDEDGSARREIQKKTLSVQANDFILT